MTGSSQPPHHTAGRKPRLRVHPPKDPAKAPATGPATAATPPAPRKQAPRGTGPKRGTPVVSAAPAKDPAASGVLAGWFGDRSLKAAQLNYFIVLGAVLALTVLGVFMVLSASSVESIGKGGSAYSLFIKQGSFALIGVVIMLVAARIKPERIRSWSWWAYAITALALVAVLTPLGYGAGGNRNWIRLGPLSIQPSEFAKLMLAIWCGVVLERKAHLMHDFRHSMVPVVFPGGLIIIGLVLAGRDLGTGMVLMMVIGAALFLGGAKKRYFAAAAGLVGLGVAGMAIFAKNRVDRISAWLGNCDDGTGLCDQAQAGLYALASGGWFGAGPGQSRQKWSHVPEAQNDFIFAILGEELGLFGALFVVLLFALLAVAMFRIAARTDSVAGRIAVGSIMVWIVGQAFINIAMVTGLLPVIGIPLPFISSGGSALIFTLAAMGVVLGYARQQRIEAGGARSRTPLLRRLALRGPAR